MNRWHFAAAGAILATAWPAPGQSGNALDLLSAGAATPSQPPLLTARTVLSHLAVAEGQTFYVAVSLTVAEGWVFYSPSPGDGSFTPVPASITADAGPWRASSVLWPADHAHETNLGDSRVITHVYTGTVVAYVPIAVPTGTPGGKHDIHVTIAGQVCSEKAFKCVPVRTEASAVVSAGPGTVANPAWTDELRAGLASAVPAGQLRGRPGLGGSPAASQLSVWGGLGLAVLAGLIMNVMPCVLPVIPIRILSVVELARQSRRRFVTVGLAFAAGVALLFVFLAAANVALRLGTGRTLNWGRHFQSIPLRLGMAMVVVAMAANLFGVFTVFVPRRLAELDSRTRRQGHLASLGMGLMMAILATPCSFAVLVLAFAWAQLQPLWLGSLAIVLVGVGMAAPHALLTAFPSLLARLPRPGRWMELLRQAMGFVLLGVAVWLVGTLSDDTRIAWAAAYAVVLVFCLWVWGTLVRYDWPLAAKLLLRGLAVALAVTAGAWMLTPPSGLAAEFQPFDESRIAQANRDGQVVLVDFTAAWCLSCKVVDYLIYSRSEVAQELAARGVLAMRGDVTAADAPANGLLYDRLRGAPPLTVIFPPSGPPIRLEGKFSRSDLTRALDDAARRPRQN